MDFKRLILDELSKSYAPVTRHHVACLIETPDGVYSGHNTEHINSIDFEHAEEMALEKMLQAGENQILRLFNAGKGHEKIKQVSPCRECYDSLSPYFLPTTGLVLFKPNTFDEVMTFSYDEHTQAYRPKPYSLLEGVNLELIMKQLEEKTLLKGKDLEFIASLRLLGIAEGVQFYLTGSASGRGWMSQQIHLKHGTSYEDMDLVAVSDLDKKGVENMFEQRFKQFYGEFNKRTSTVNIWFIGENEKRERISYSVNGKDIVDLCIAPTLKEGMVRMDYLNKNFFHQIS